MSCFPLPPLPGLVIRKVNSNDHTVEYSEGWKNTQDSQQRQFQVSEKEGDTATFYFKGFAVYVLGRIGSSGMNALFAIDNDTLPNHHGGTSCQKPQGPNPQNILPLYDSGSLDSRLHTILITNKGGQLSLNAFEVIGGSEISDSPTSQGNGPAPTTNIPSTISGPPSSIAAPLPTSINTSPAAGSGPSNIQVSPSPSSPFPFPSATSNELSSNLFRTASDSPGTTRTNAGEQGSYSSSRYTEISIVSGSTTTIVVQTVVEVQKSSTYGGPSRGAVAGASVGGILFLFLILGLGLWWWRRRRNRVRFLYGISNLDFDPDMMTRSPAELQSQGPGVRDSDATLYGNILPTYKEPASYSSLALELSKHPPSECAASVVAGDRRLTAYTEPSTRSPSVRSLCDKHSVSGQESVERVVPLSKDGIL